MRRCRRRLLLGWQWQWCDARYCAQHSNGMKKNGMESNFTKLVTSSAHLLHETTSRDLSNTKRHHLTP